ncbi:MAG TPA: class I SAM-dependent methyltransferase [Verrucomicrobiae bacterium]|nr:class I SAM-dependent methyltransferase [Verrucomicrobiae bacterium]
MTPSTFIPPCVLHEDEHLLVVNKPAGWNTHSPSPYAGEGIYEWLKHREPRWAHLAIIHRLDKETSGVMVFGKTQLANRSLTEQFARRAVRKTYVLLSERSPKRAEFTIKARIVRAGDRYVSGNHGEEAETRFEIRNPKSEIRNAEGQLIPCCELAADPRTGRTHQIRVHAAANGFPIMGDALYGGAPFGRLCLHARELFLTHPVSQAPVTFTAAPDFLADPSMALRTAIIEPGGTDAFRLIHGASDRWPHWYVEQFGEHLLSQSENPLTAAQQARLQSEPRSVYQKALTRRVRGATAAQSSPHLVMGRPAPERFVIHENGVKFAISFNEGYSVGLFLDQRENRRRLLTRHISAGFPLGADLKVLNTFAYTCGFSACAAKAGAHTTSLDLSKKYLEWGKHNFALNELDPIRHDFLYGDTFDWLKRLARKGRNFDVVILDPPTFSQSKEHGVFRAEKDYGKLVKAALPVLNPGGVLFASTNAAERAPEKFLGQINDAITHAGRKIVQQHYVPQPPDFPISRDEPAYLKTVWLRVS